MSEIERDGNDSWIIIALVAGVIVLTILGVFVAEEMAEFSSKQSIQLEFERGERDAVLKRAYDEGYKKGMTDD